MSFKDDTTRSVESCGPDCECAASDGSEITGTTRKQSESCGPDCECTAPTESETTDTTWKRGAAGAAAGAGALSALAGCLTSGGASNDTKTNSSNTTTPTTTITPNTSGDAGNGTKTTSSGNNTTTTTTTTSRSDSGSSGNMQSITFMLNGKKQTFDVDPNTKLLYVLRDMAGKKGPKFGCGLSQCGACAVLVGNNATRSCVTPVKSVAGKKVTTTRGLGTEDNPSSLQQAFIDHQAAQCGYCISGMIIKSESFLRQNSNPSRDDIKQALDGHLCRCGTHNRIVDAVEQAAGDR